MFMSPDEFPLPYEYRDMDLRRGLLGAPPEDIDERTVVFLDCGNIDRMPVDFLQRDGIHILNIDHHHDNTRFGTVNLVAPEASCTAEIVCELAKELGVRDHARDRRRALRRPRHRHRQVHVREHDARGPPHGRRADRGRGRAAPASTAASSRTCPSAACCCSSARSQSVQRLDDGAITIAHLIKRGLRGDGRARDRLRGHRRPHARGRGHEGRGARARAARRRPRRAAQGEPALDRRPRRRVAHRARARRRRPPPGGRLHHRAAVSGSSWRGCATEVGRAALHCRPGRDPLPEAGRGHLARCRRARAPRAARAARKVGHAGTLDPFATGLLLVLVGRLRAPSAC